MKKLLLHTCCGPCATGVLPEIKKVFDTSGFYYNPNIYPESEYQKRLISAQNFFNLEKIKLIVPEQAREEFFEYIGEIKIKPERCLRCYTQRLSKTAEYAKENGFSYFSTTLLVSPYQDHESLKEVGIRIGEEHGAEFYYQDFRPNFKKSRDIAEKLELYLQKYCGCKHSRKRK